MSTILRLDHWTVGYLDEPIVRDVDLEITQGTVTTLLGGNGAGKSTLLRSLFGIGKRFRGDLIFEGRSIGQMSSRERLLSGMALVPQGRCNFPLLTVRENLEMGAYTLDRSSGRAAIERVADRYPLLRQKWNVPAGNLSGGQQQILEIAMALVLAPRLVLLDEPTLGLSPTMQDEVFDEVEAIRRNGATVVIAEQNVTGCLEISDRAVVLELGRIFLDGPAGAVMTDPRIRVAYLGEEVAA